MKRILVTGAGGSAAANFIKSLRLAPEPFYIVGTDIQPYHLQLAEVDKRYILPPASDPDYINRLNLLLERERIEFVHPQPDVEVLMISENRERINAKLFLPSKETIRICQDKMKTFQRLASKDVAVPASYFVSNVRDLEEALEVLLKKHEKVWLRATRGAGARASLPVCRLEHARAWIDYWAFMHGVGYGQFMVSEFLPGKEFAFQSLWYNGKLIVSQARERIQYIFGHLTPSGQTSSPSVAKTVHRKDVNEIATKAVLAVDPNATGVFCVDLKENRDGIPCVTEINAGRFFTTSNFFAEAGCNMPYYYVKLAFGEEIPCLPQYDVIPEGWYWVRMVDMGHKLIKGEQWQAEKV